MKPRTTLAIALLASTPAWGQAIYRCGNTYADRPCPGARAVEAADERLPEQRAQSERAAQRDARLADTLERDRLRAEKRAQALRPVTVKVRSRTEPARDDSEFDFADDLSLRDQPFVARVPRTAGDTRPGKGRTGKPSDSKHPR
ncbi:hypothetical protein [Ramlibacter rhizophilus]|uniref:DUF4124 domain-containing protein n=1 Tax=Ramlibacter rhizophilus TaxID=1781167 RepID=A0A4Z0BS98_9BURK|nr:hypothetical protein [Ramlibacter rhizophilus]TFZ01138.1 hypothetical protein EZ242_07025 [Ramlibacter rhizophilus]